MPVVVQGNRMSATGLLIYSHLVDIADVREVLELLGGQPNPIPAPTPDPNVIIDVDLDNDGVDDVRVTIDDIEQPED